MFLKYTKYVESVLKKLTCVKKTIKIDKETKLNEDTQQKTET